MPQPENSHTLYKNTYHWLCWTKKIIYLWEVSSWSKSAELLIRRVENSHSGQGSYWERSWVVSRISKSLFRDAPATVPEHVLTCGFRRKSSSLDRAPKERDSVLLNSSVSFLVILPSISCETCVTYASVIPGTNAFCDWLFLALSYVCLETAANFRLFLRNALALEERKSSKMLKLNWYFILKWILDRI